MADKSMASLPYQEPGITTILLQSSFILLLNAVNFLLNKTLYCGLLGQVFLGIAFGTPGAKWIGTQTEDVMVQLGYLGLLLLVFEGKYSCRQATRIEHTDSAFKGGYQPLSRP
jgi:hypothetical protein